MIIIVSLTFTKKEPFKDNKEAIYFWVVVIACYGWFVILKRMGLCKSLPNEWNKNYWFHKTTSKCIIKKPICHYNLVDKGIARIFCLTITTVSLWDQL